MGTVMECYYPMGIPIAISKYTISPWTCHGVALMYLGWWIQTHFWVIKLPKWCTYVHVTHANTLPTWQHQDPHWPMGPTNSWSLPFAATYTCPHPWPWSIVRRHWPSRERQRERTREGRRETRWRKVDGQYVEYDLDIDNVDVGLQMNSKCCFKI